MGSKGGTSTSTVQIPQDVLNRYNAVNANAENVAKTPFQQYGGQFVAPLTSTQQAGIANTNTAANQAQPYFGAATSAATNAYQGAQPYQDAATALAAGSTQQVNAQPLDISTYLSPYLNTVLGSTASLLNQNNQQQQAGQLGNAIRSGAFGGDRAGIAAANLAQQQNLGNAKIYSDIANQGFNTALGAAQQQQGVNLGAGQANRAALLSGSNALAGIGQQGYAQGMGLSQQLAGLGTGAQGAALQGAQAQLGAGQAEQQTQQAQNTALYNQFLQEKSYPFQVAQFLANIAEGTGSLSGSTTTTNSVQNGIFSDRRLKTDIKPIGKTYDGQTIYSYRYKGEKHTEIGLIAQEVEKKHPHAVGLAGGHKTVDYGHATDHAARKGHFAAGGGVSPMSAGEGFYTGGLASGYDPALMAQLMANYQAMYGPLLSHQPLGGLVPQSNGPAPVLHPAEAEPIHQQDVAQNINNWVNAGENLAKGYGAIKGLAGKMKSPGDAGLGAAKSAVESKFGDGASALADSALNNHITDALSEINPDELASLAGLARGGLARADGGAIPYLGDEGKPMGIPDDQRRYELLKPDKQQEDHGPGFLGTVGALGGAAAGLATLFSDKRVKENIHAVGETFDGQKVYRYNYKGDDTPRMGLLAQEVEKHHPGAVGEARGLKTVDYAKATSKAAKRGKFADGGSPDDGFLDRTLGKLKTDFDSQIEHGNDLLRESRENAPDTSDADDDGAEPIRVSPALAKIATKDSATRGNASDGARATRNNNPGNIEDGPFARKMPGYKGSDGRFAVFDSAESGRNAQLALLRGYLTKGLDTPLKIASRWAPAAEKGNNPQRYASFIAGKLGIKPTDPVTPDMLPGLASAQAAAEGWSAPKRAAGGRAGLAGGGEPTLEDDFDATFGSPVAVADGNTVEAPAPISRNPDVGNAPLGRQYGLDAGAQVPSDMGVPQDIDVDNKRGFFKGLGHGDASSIIPLLTGIGALATTQTDNPLTAIAAGLGAGAGASQKLREFRLDQEKAREAARQAQQAMGINRGVLAVAQGRLPYEQLQLGAQAGLLGAQAGQTQALTQPMVAKLLAEGRLNQEQANVARSSYIDTQVMPDGGVLVLDKSDPTNPKAIRYFTKDEVASFYNGAPTTAGSAPPTGAKPPTASPVPAPAGNPSAPAQPTAPVRWSTNTMPTNTSVIRPPAIWFSKQFGGNGATLAAAQQKAIGDLGEYGRTAAEAQTQLANLTRVKAGFERAAEHGALVPGAGGESRTELVNTVNTLRAMLGGKPMAATATNEELNKDLANLATQTADRLSSNVGGSVMRAAQRANLSLSNTPAGAAFLYEGLLASAERAINFQKYATAYAQQPAARGTLYGVEAAFNRDHPPEMYAKLAAKRAVIDIARRQPAMTAGLNKMLAIRSTGDRDALADYMRNFNGRWGPGLAEAFLGR